MRSPARRLASLAWVASLAGYAFPLGENLRGRLAGSWRTDAWPGVVFSYANLNYVVVGADMEAAAGERFDRLMRRLVFRPLRRDACFNW